MASGVRDIDIGLLRAFVAVAETGGMTAAGRVVHLSQGAVSQQIKRLEALFETQLFDRSGETMALTRDGERLMSRARRLIGLNDDVFNQMRGEDFSGEVRLGVAHDIVASLLPPVLRRFQNQRPHVLVTLVSDTSSRLRQQLRERSIDLAVLTESRRGSGDTFLFTDTLVWAGAPDGTAYRRRPLSVALGQEHCAFRSAAIDALNRAGIEWRVICQVGSLEPVFATLEADMAVAPFLSRTVPARLAALDRHELPVLPAFHINLRTPSNGVDLITDELARQIREAMRADPLDRGIPPVRTSG
ncbi:LysR family transcriptional regulator [Tahibacter amnicola]|uniref:LysR substrate-binding domain-containing protein n=1 Tax=Tahibacter amnicola TaxID=2976241 RepID=A0ABY6BD45_9GAMM|nr:LysR substrate-binding domain-containing protein [Tahibacter amnicola]UXI65832.1 LysR substrate-binding domain-containing protein [Tahibacter amnicola]